MCKVFANIWHQLLHQHRIVLLQWSVATTNTMHVWDAVVGEILPCSSEDGNLCDPYVEAVKKGSVIEWMPTEDHSD